MRFEGKVALVTGGTRGIGKAIATMFAREGAAVALNYQRRKADADETVRELEALGAKALAVKADVRDREKMHDFVTRVVEELGGVDILVSNAASGSNKAAMELSEVGWDWTMNINARALLVLAQEVVPSMRSRGGGRIVGITSLGSHFVLPNYTSVGVSKAALECLTRYLAVELAPDKITVNCVSGSVVETGALNYFANKEQMLQAGRERTPAGRMVEPEDLANAVGFLCSPEAEMIVGQSIVVDGGFSLGSGLG